MVASGERILKVSVKGSQDGGWGLTQSYMKDGDYHGATDAWVRRHKPRTVLCFVQLQGVALDQLPRVYLATPAEVAARLKASAKGRGETILYERHEWGPRAHGSGSMEEVPAAWRFSAERVERLLSDA